MLMARLRSAAIVPLVLLPACRSEPKPDASEPVAAVAPATEPVRRDAGAVARDSSGAVSTRTYDLSALVADVPRYEVADGVASVIGVVRAVEGCDHCGMGMDTPAGRADSIARLVRDTIAPQTWRERDAAAAGRGAMHVVDATLVITHTAGVHGQIAELLTQLGETRAVAVDVETRLLTVPGAVARRDAVLKGVGESVVALDERGAADLVKRVRGARGAEVVTAPRLSVPNGARAVALSATETAYVSAIETGGEAGEAKPVVGMVTAGLAVTLGPTVSADRKSITLVVEPRAARLLAMRAEKAGVGGHVQVPVTANWRVRRVVSVAAGGAYLLPLGEAEVRPDAAAGRVQERLYVLVRPAVTVLPAPRFAAAAAR